MTVVLAAGISAVALGIVAVLGATAVRLLRVQQPGRGEARIDRTNQILADMSALQLKVDALPSLWEHERKVAQDAKAHADKQYRAAAQARAIAEGGADRGDPEDVDDADEFLRANARAGDSQGVLPLHPDVEKLATDDLTERALAVGWSPLL